MTLDKIQQFLEITNDPNKAIFDLSQNKIGQEEFEAHAEENHYEHGELADSIAKVKTIKGDKGDTGGRGKRDE